MNATARRRFAADQMRFPLLKDPAPTAGAFVRGDSNRRAAEVLDAWPDGPEHILALVGPVGSGKSHLAGLWAERTAAVGFSGAEVARADMPDLEGRPILLDDADQADDATLFHLMNLAQAPGGALLLVSREPPSVWSTALPDLRSRLDSIRTVAVEAPDDAVLAAMLEARFAERGIRPAKDVIPYLLRRIDRSAAAAAEVVARLDAMHRPVTRALAREVVEGAEESGELFE